MLGRSAIAKRSSKPPFPRLVFCSPAKLSAPGSSFAFRCWSYATTSITFDHVIFPAISNLDTLVYLNISSGVSLVDKAGLVKKHPSQKISTMLVPLKVRGIGASRLESEEFAFTTLFMPGLDRKGSKVYTWINYKLHLVEDLKANMLIENNVFCTEGFKINLANASAYIFSYAVTIVINARNHLQVLRCNVLANSTTFIPPKSEASINFRQMFLPDSRNFLFQPFL